MIFDNDISNINTLITDNDSIKPEFVMNDDLMMTTDLTRAPTDQVLGT